MKIPRRLRSENEHKRPKKRPNPNRPTFGFQCDRELARRVKSLAHAFDVPIYTLGERALQCGLAQVGVQMANSVNANLKSTRP